MFSSHVISASEHQSWFEALRDDPSRRVFVYLLEGKKLGWCNSLRLTKRMEPPFGAFISAHFPQ